MAKLLLTELVVENTSRRRAFQRHLRHWSVYLSVTLLTFLSPFARAGTSDRGGGGNTNSAAAPSTRELLNLIEGRASNLYLDSLKWNLYRVFYRLESLTIENSPRYFASLKYRDSAQAAQLYESVERRLFAQAEHTVYRELKGLRFTARLDGPCRDLNHAARDGSAFGTNQDEICLSLPRLKKKLNGHSALVEVLALAAHEVAHRVGADESEARILQSVVMHEFGALNRDVLVKAILQADLFPAVMPSEFSEIEALLLKRDTSLVPEICAKVGSVKEKVSSQLSRLYGLQNTQGVQIVRPGAIRALNGARIQLEQLMGFCFSLAPSAALPVNQPTSVAFLGGKSSKLSPSQDEGQVRRVEVGNWEAAQFNASEATRNLRRYYQFIHGI